MSDRLFHLRPEQLMERSRLELKQQAVALGLIITVLTKPGLTLKELEELVLVEMPEVRTGLSQALNYFREAEAQRDKLQPALDLWRERVGDSVDGEQSAVGSLLTTDHRLPLTSTKEGTSHE